MSVKNMEEMTRHFVISGKSNDTNCQFLKLDQTLMKIGVTTTQHVIEQPTFTKRHLMER